MAITHNDLLVRSDDLLTTPNATEIVWREATRLAYYSAFHFARELATRLPEPQFDKGYRPRSHEKVISTFKQVTSNSRFRHISRECAAVATMLLKAGGRRNTADYELGESLTGGFARHQVFAVKQLRGELQRIIDKLEQKASQA